MLSETLKTTGDYRTEAEGWEHFDSIVAQFPDLFELRKEKWGYYIQPRCGSELKTPRIDRVLLPKPKLVQAGWKQGPIGIECKTSGKKVGPVLAQAQDYSRALFEIQEGWNVALRWIFIWQLEKCIGELASVMAQNRIGSVSTSPYCALKFQCAETNGIVISHSGEVTCTPLKMGNRAGSR